MCGSDLQNANRTKEISCVLPSNARIADGRHRTAGSSRSCRPRPASGARLRPRGSACPSLPSRTGSSGSKRNGHATYPARGRTVPLGYTLFATCGSARSAVTRLIPARPGGPDRHSTCFPVHPARTASLHESTCLHRTTLEPTSTCSTPHRAALPPPVDRALGPRSPAASPPGPLNSPVTEGWRITPTASARKGNPVSMSVLLSLADRLLLPHDASHVKALRSTNDQGLLEPALIDPSKRTFLRHPARSPWPRLAAGSRT